MEKATLNELLDLYYELEETAQYEDAKTRAYDVKVQKLTRILLAQKKVNVKLTKQAELSEQKANSLQERSYELDKVVQNYLKTVQKRM